MPLEIPEDPDFDNIQKHLKDSFKNDFMNYLLKEDHENPNPKIIHDHFKHYNSCIDKIVKHINTQQKRIQDLQEAAKYQSKVSEELYLIVKSNKDSIKEIKLSKPSFYQVLESIYKRYFKIT